MRDTEGDEAARHGAPARRRPRDPETDISINEIETKRRRLDGLREPDRLSPPNASHHSSIEKNESIRGVPIGESRAYYKPGIRTPYLLTGWTLSAHLQAKNAHRYHLKRTCTRNP